MRKSLRLVLLAATGLVALSLAEAAAAVYVPRLFADNVSNGVEITFRQTEADDATAFLIFYVPSAYSATLGQMPGTTIGQVSARVEARAVGPGVILTLTGGTVVTDNPANHVSNLCAPGLHQAVWIFVLPIPGQAEPFRIPVYVDPTAGAPDAAFGAYRLRACLASPNVPESQGGARLGAKLLEATFTLNGVFTPQGSGVLQWVGHFFPYLPASRVPNTAGRVESRALIRTPGQVTLRGQRVTRTRRVRGKRVQRHFARLTGRVTEAGEGVAGATVRITGLSRARTVRTNANGNFSIIVAVGRTTTFRAATTVPDRDVTSAGCAGATTPPCVSASASGFQARSAPARVTVPRAKKRR